MNIDFIFHESQKVRTFSTLVAGSAEGPRIAGIGGVRFNLRAFEEDRSEQCVAIGGSSAGLSVFELIGAKGAGATFQWEVTNPANLNVLFGVPGINDFDRLPNRQVMIITDSPPVASNLRGLFMFYNDLVMGTVMKLLFLGTKVTLKDLLAPSESFALIELKDLGFNSATVIKGASGLI